MDDPDVTGVDSPSDRPTQSRAGSFFGWYHHAVAPAYSVSAAVSARSMPLDRLALYFLASFLGSYLALAVLTVLWRRLVPHLL
jgi:glycerol uptake facilitator-like aquaporin